MSAAPTGRQAPATPAVAPGPSTAPPVDDDMLDNSDEDDDDLDQTETIKDLKRQTRAQARQITSMMELVNQLTAQVMATPNERPRVTKPKMTAPEKFDGNALELQTFLTNIDLYCEYNGTPNEQEKILIAGVHLKGRAAKWMQPYTADYLKNPLMGGTKKDTQTLFESWDNFKKEAGRIFGEVDDEDQAEKAITRLKQTKSASAYTAEFKQLQSRIDWDDAALRTVYENGLKDNIKDSLVHHDKPEDLHSLIELATRIDHRLWERSQQKGRNTFTPANTKRHRYVKVDKEGDVIMADKVQEKGKGRNTQGRRPDGLSKEERQRRYDNKACLRCGKEGHFRRNCPENETGKQGAVKIGMIRQGTPYPHPVQLSDSEVSDMELYEEARLLGEEAYELVPRARGAPDMVQHTMTRETDWIITGAEVQRRLEKRYCWVCGHDNYIAENCY